MNLNQCQQNMQYNCSLYTLVEIIITKILWNNKKLSKKVSDTKDWVCYYKDYINIVRVVIDLYLVDLHQN